MGIALNFNTTEFDDLIKEVESLGPAARRALVRAIQKTIKTMSSQATRDIAKRSRVPVKALTQGGTSGRGKRVFTRVPPLGDFRGRTARDPSASVWIGYEPMQAAYLGKLEQLPTGARAGSGDKLHEFPGSFLATMRPSLHRSIFYRAGNARRQRADNKWGSTELPIEEERVPLTVAEEVIREIELAGRSRLRSVLVSEMNYELNVKKRR